MLRWETDRKAIMMQQRRFKPLLHQDYILSTELQSAIRNEVLIVASIMVPCLLMVVYCSNKRLHIEMFKL